MKKVILFVLFIGMVGHAQAAFIVSGDVDNTFNYGTNTDSTGVVSTDFFNWTAGFVNSDGSIDTETAFNGEFQMIGSDLLDADGFGCPGTFLDLCTSTNMLTTSSEAGTISVDWDYFTGDVFAEYDPFVWLYDGVATTITNDALGFFDDGSLDDGIQFGTFSATVAAGVDFGFAILSDNYFGDGLSGADVGLLNLNFVADPFQANPPTAAPVPPAFLLFGTALAGLFFRKKKAAA